MEISVWITAIATTVIAISTIVYVIITTLTLTSIKSQLAITEKQLYENVRTTSLTIQPFLSITKATIKLLAPKDIQTIGAYFEGYQGTISIKLQIANNGLGPAQNIQVSSFLIANVDDKVQFMGLFSQMIPSLQQQDKFDVTCDDNQDMSHTYISLTGAKGDKLKSLSLAVFQFFQDVSGQRHLQYQIFSQIPEVLKEKLISQAEIAREILNFLTEKAKSPNKINQISGEDNILCVPIGRNEDESMSFLNMTVDTLKNIALANTDAISSMLLPDEEIELTNTYDSSTLVSQGLPNPLETEKSFETIKKQLLLGKFKSEKGAIAHIIKEFVEYIS